MGLHAVRKLTERTLLQNDVVGCQETGSGMVLLRVGLEPADDVAPRLIGEEQTHVASKELMKV